jgi:hypothetical protein
MPGCLLVSVGWLPGATLTVTVTYHDGTHLTVTGTANAQGLLHCLLNVTYRPPSTARHGQTSTVAYISVIGVRNTLHTGPVTLRFGVIAQ